MSFLPTLVNEINLLRTDPKKYAEKIRSHKEYFQGNVLRIPGSNIGIKTHEGPEAYEEAAKFLEGAKPLCSVEPSKGLMKIAQEFLGMIQKTEPSKLGKINMQEIIDKYGSFSGRFSRAMEFGGCSPEQVVINLTVSDGDKSRSQRNSIFDENLKMVGVANGTHDSFKICTVIVSCTEFTNTIDADDSYKFEDVPDTQKSAEQPKAAQPEAPKQPEPKPEPPKQTEPKPEAPKQPEPKSEAPKQEAKPEPPKQEAKPEQPKQPEAKKEPLKQEAKPAAAGSVSTVGLKEVPFGTHKEEDVVETDKTEKIIVERGKKKRLITIIKKMKDGTFEKNVIKENIK